MVISANTIITAGGVLGALGAIFTLLWRVLRWIEHQKEQDERIEEFKRQLTESKEEQQLHTYGLLACLKGLQEQGCNGPVTDAIAHIEKYLNKRAHKTE